MNPTRVLVVEDERIIARGIEKQLKEMGYAVAGSAATGEDAVLKAVELRPDLILMDIALGAGIDGVEASARIRAQMDVPIVFLTANSDDTTRRRAILTDPFGYVVKPYENTALQTAIEIGLYRHKMEWRLRENERWLAATLSSIGDGVIAVDEKGHVRLMNVLAEKLTGWQQADALGRDVRDIFLIIQERSRESVRNPVIDALASGKTATLAPDTILIDKAGRERSVEDSASPIRNDKGATTGAVLVFRDITERKRLEDRLRQSQKMEAVGRLAGGIAHDFNNIMTIILGYSELLLAKSSTADHLDYGRHIHDAGLRAAALTQQIMAFSRKQLLVPCVLNLNVVVRDLGGMVKRLIGEDIEFVTDLAADLGHVKADPTQLGQVILNLATNARDAMRNGGRLLITTAEGEPGAPTPGGPPDAPQGRFAVLSVSDTGIGMSAEVLAHVFDPFFTTKGVGEGTGLGLATVYGIVEQSGGHVEVTSKVDEGTTFRVYLPVVAEPITPPGSRYTPPPAKGHETILLVEDDDTVRALTKLLLERSGYAVLEAATGSDAVGVAEQHAGPIHLLITDLVMPRMSGREVAESLTALRPGLRVLFVSGYTEDMIVRQGVESAVADFLHKPFTLDSLSAKVREILDCP